MSKRLSRRNFIALAIVVAILIVLSICKFPIPFTNYNYNGFANSISLGLDLRGGISVVYNTSLPEGSTANLDESIDGTMERLSDMLLNNGFSEATVSKQDGTRIRVEVPGVSDTKEIFNIIGKPAELYIRSKEATDNNPTLDPENNILTGKDITNVKDSYQQTSSSGNPEYGVVLEFTSSGADKFYNLTKEVKDSGGTIFIYLGTELFSKLEVKEAISGGSTFISGGNITDSESAKEYALKIKSGTFEVVLDVYSNNVVSATLGADALKWSIIAGIIGLALVMIFMYIVYGDYGLLANVALIIYICLMLFFLQAIPFIQLTLPGIAGVVLSLGMAVDANIIIFERIKDEYAVGKKIPMATKAGFKKAFWSIFDANITTIIASIVLWILGTPSIQGFAITLCLGIILSMFTSLVVTRLLIKWYLPLNSTKPKRLRLKREVTVDELA